MEHLLKRLHDELYTLSECRKNGEEHEYIDDNADDLQLLMIQMITYITKEEKKDAA